MAETSGLRGLCTAPRRRCCPAWRWTATAWARPPPDACPLRAYRARCRLGSTWPASTSTRTRVSALRRANPRCPPPTPCPREGGPGNNSGFVPQRSRRLPLGLFTGLRAVSALRAGRPPGPGLRLVRRRPRRGARGSAASPGSPGSHSPAEIGAVRGDSNPLAPVAEARLELSGSGREKKPVLHPLRPPFPERESILG